MNHYWKNDEISDTEPAGEESVDMDVSGADVRMCGCADVRMCGCEIWDMSVVKIELRMVTIASREKIVKQVD